MKDLIKALEIFIKYVGDINYPFHAEHDIIYVCLNDFHIKNMKQKDIKKLEELGFDWIEEREQFISYRYGDC